MTSYTLWGFILGAPFTPWRPGFLHRPVSIVADYQQKAYLDEHAEKNIHNPRGGKESFFHPQGLDQRIELIPWVFPDSREKGKRNQATISWLKRLDFANGVYSIYVGGHQYFTYHELTHQPALDEGFTLFHSNERGLDRVVQNVKKQMPENVLYEKISETSLVMLIKNPRDLFLPLCLDYLVNQAEAVQHGSTIQSMGEVMAKAIYLIDNDIIALTPAHLAEVELVNSYFKGAIKSGVSDVDLAQNLRRVMEILKGYSIILPEIDYERRRKEESIRLRTELRLAFPNAVEVEGGIDAFKSWILKNLENGDTPKK